MHMAFKWPSWLRTPPLPRVVTLAILGQAPGHPTTPLSSTVHFLHYANFGDLLAPMRPPTPRPAPSSSGSLPPPAQPESWSVDYWLCLCALCQPLGALVFHCAHWQNQGTANPVLCLLEPAARLLNVSGEERTGMLCQHLLLGNKHHRLQGWK